jgi:hypothetical protein
MADQTRAEWLEIEQRALRNYRNGVYTFNIGDKVLVTHALTIGMPKEYGDCIGKTATVVDIDTRKESWPYVLDICPKYRWLECDLRSL